MKKSTTRKDKAVKNSEKYLITAALPYANGPIHIGHLLEYIQADIYVRFLKSQGKEAVYVCASDMHGTPVEVNAAKAGKKPEQFALEFWKEHQQDFKSFLIEFDNFYKTHSPENKEFAELFFTELKKKGYIYRKKINVVYCPHCQRHLPDRYVRGTCPYCTTAHQYGDVCESCGSVLKSVDLINPRCVICGKNPQVQESEHYFFALSKFAGKLRAWAKNRQPEVNHWLDEWFTKGLDDWCISRDAPYFGFEIPGAEEETGEKKYFYVWLDAPIGYISSTKNYCDRMKCQWQDYWCSGKVHHFIGKDISYFHFLFWPAMLMAMNIPLPEITVHGFVKVNGEKMSKSRGTFFTAKDFLKLYAAEALRFYYASHLDTKVLDVDLNFEDFKAVNNNVFMGSLGNFCYRVLTFAEKNYGLVKEIAAEKEKTTKVTKMMKRVEQCYAELNFKEAIKEIVKIADVGNAYFQESEVWKNKESAKAKKVVGWCVNLARNLAIVAAPVVPEFSGKIAQVLGEKEWSWKHISFSWQGKVNNVKLLVRKIEKVPQASIFPLHLVVGEILQVKNHPQADSLYLLQVNLGKESGKKQVVAGLKKYFKAEQLVHKKAVFCVNIEPAVIRGEKSEAMVLAADDGQHVAILEADKTKVGEGVEFFGMEHGGGKVSFEDFKKLIITVAGGKIFFEGKKLSSKVEDVIVRSIGNGARVR